MCDEHGHLARNCPQYVLSLYQKASEHQIFLNLVSIDKGVGTKGGAKRAHSGG